MMKHSVIAALAMAWLAVIFFIAAAGAPHYYTYDKDNSVGAFRACYFGTCRDYGSTLTDWGRGLQAMIVLAILTTFAGATVMTMNLFKTFSYQHLIASVLMLLGALWGLIAMGIAADHFNGRGGWHLGASFVLNTLAWLLNLGSVGAYAYWVYTGEKGLHGQTNAPTGSANV